MKKYFYALLFKYLSLYIFKEDRVVSVEPVSDRISQKLKQVRIFTRENKKSIVKCNKTMSARDVKTYNPDYILLDGTIHYDENIQDLFKDIHGLCRYNTRLVVVFYNSMWRPLVRLSVKMGLRDALPEENWVSPNDVNNFLRLSDFETVHSSSRILIPFYIPLLSNIINRYIAPLPLFNLFNIVNFTIAKSCYNAFPSPKPSVSVVVAARNEEQHIDDIIKRVPTMGPDDELIIIEGNSTDRTWDKIQEAYEAHKNSMNLKIGQQNGKGKGDAVRKGFDMATKEIFMILDADLTVPPEELPKFYEAILSGKGEYINGSRLVYPMDDEAMRYANIIGNKFFALAFSFVLGQRFKDTLCGTKVISRENYLQLAKHRCYFGDFDPFGDFDLIFGASRMCLKIVEVPIKYRKRVYGDTNISRWSHGVILLKMLLFASRKIKFI